MGLSEKLTEFFHWVTGNSDKMANLESKRTVDEGKAQSIFSKYKKEFESKVDEITQNLVSGKINTREWKYLVTAEIRYLMITTAAIGAGGLGMLSKEDIQQVDAAVAKQAKFLDGFASQVERTPKEDLKFNKLKNRTVQYFGSARPILEKVIARSGGRPALPFQPAEATDCGNNCYCTWSWRVVDAEKGDYDVYWILSDVDHCETCNTRARVCNPLKIRNGTIVTDLSNPKLMSEFND